MGIVKLIAVGMTAVVGLGAVGIAISYGLFARSIGDDVARLVAAARPAAATISEAMLADLPAPAQLYVRQAGVVGRPIPTTVHLTQKGRMRGSATDSWMALEADETYSVDPPAFVWRAWIPAAVMPVVLGRDEYLGGDGSILMKALAVVPVADQRGEELRAAGLMRYLNETMWFPAALLDRHVQLSAVDDRTFRATLTDGPLTAEALFMIDAGGRLINFRAQRFNTTTQRLETWETPVGSYGVFDGLNLPASGQAVWKLEDGDFAYIELTITGIDQR